jgi:hypothetical protein
MDKRESSQRHIHLKPAFASDGVPGFEMSALPETAVGCVATPQTRNLFIPDKNPSTDCCLRNRQKTFSFLLPKSTVVVEPANQPALPCRTAAAKCLGRPRSPRISSKLAPPMARSNLPRHLPCPLSLCPARASLPLSPSCSLPLHPPCSLPLNPPCCSCLAGSEQAARQA